MIHNFAVKELCNIQHIVHCFYLLPSDCHLLPALRLNLDGHTFKDDREVETAVTRWLITHATDYCQQGIVKFNARRDRCIICCGNFVEK